MDGAFASGTTWAKAGIAALTKTTARSVFRYITILHWIQCIDGFNQHRILFSAEIPFLWIACFPPSWAEPRSWEIRTRHGKPPAPIPYRQQPIGPTDPRS